MAKGAGLVYRKRRVKVPVSTVHCILHCRLCRDDPSTCRRCNVRDEVLERQFTDLSGKLQFDDEVLERVRDALDASHVAEMALAHAVSDKAEVAFQCDGLFEKRRAFNQRNRLSMV
jgi:hypothetical protein